MKTNKISIAFALASVVFTACQQKLPYDLQGTEHGVVIDIRKVQGASTTLSTDMNDGDYKVLLTIPEQQGDYSMLKEAQIMAIYTDGAKNKKSAKVVTGIKEFPYTATINIADACSKLGVSTIEIGDRIEFTPCVTLNSGTQVDGWSELGGFNNTIFTGWQLPNGPFSYRVAYTAFAPFNKDAFKGDAIPWSDGTNSDVCKVTQITELPQESSIPSGVTAADLVGLKVEGDIWFGGDTFTLWINTQDYTLIMPDQVICPDFTYGTYGTYDGMATQCEGEVDTLNNSLWFYFYSVWGPYSFGDGTITLQF
jgi:hypothetical protein